MALVYDTANMTVDVGADSAGPYAGPITFSHDNQGDGLLLVLVGGGRETGASPVDPSVTFNAITVTQNKLGQNVSSSATSPDIAMFTLESPAAGSNTVSVTLDNSYKNYVIVAIPVTNFQTGDLVGTDFDQILTSPSSATSSLTITTDENLSDRLLLSCWRDPTTVGAITPGSGVTELFEETSNASGGDTDCKMGLYKITAPTAGAGIVDCSVDAADRRSAIAMELKGIAAAGGGGQAATGSWVIGL